MGLNSTVVIMNDSLHAIKDDDNFGEKVYYAVQNLYSSSSKRKDNYISSAGHVNAALVVETHHSSAFRLVLVGGNSGLGLDVLLSFEEVRDVNGNTNELEMKVLQALAKKCGYALRKKND